MIPQVYLYDAPYMPQANRRYAELVAEDRELRLHGYEVYRFGAAELVDLNLARQWLSAFLNRLAA